MPKWDRIWRVQLLSGTSSFEEFVLKRLELAVAQEALHFRPQYSFITDKSGVVRMDFIGRFENLDADLARIAARLDIPLALAHLNPSTHVPYQSAYTPAMRDLVARVYACDIELFGYRFEQ